MSLQVKKISQQLVGCSSPPCLNVAAVELNSEQHVNHKTARRPASFGELKRTSETNTFK